MKGIKIILGSCFLLTVLAGCKPTEKNYQSAYDKAYEAAQRRNEELTLGYGDNRLESLDGPRMEIIGGDTLYISSTTVTPYEAERPSTTQGSVGIAVARYSMPTNARRHVKDLKEDYPEAFVATDGDDNYYVVAITVPSTKDAVGSIHEFESSRPDYRYIGLEGHPLLLVVP